MVSAKLCQQSAGFEAKYLLKPALQSPSGGEFRRNWTLNIGWHCYQTCGPQTNKSFNTGPGSNRQDLTLESVWIHHFKAAHSMRIWANVSCSAAFRSSTPLDYNTVQPQTSNIWHLNRSSLYAVVSDISHRDPTRRLWSNFDFKIMVQSWGNVNIQSGKISWTTTRISGDPQPHAPTSTWLSKPIHERCPLLQWD